MIKGMRKVPGLRLICVYVKSFQTKTYYLWGVERVPIANLLRGSMFSLDFRFKVDLKLKGVFSL